MRGGVQLLLELQEREMKIVGEEGSHNKRVLSALKRVVSGLKGTIEFDFMVQFYMHFLRMSLPREYQNWMLIWRWITLHKLRASVTYNTSVRGEMSRYKCPRKGGIYGCETWNGKGEPNMGMGVGRVLRSTCTTGRRTTTNHRECLEVWSCIPP